MVYIPDYSSGLAALGQGVSAGTKSLTDAWDASRKQQSLSALGTAVANKDYPAAIKAAGELGSPDAIMSIAKLGAAADDARTAGSLWGDILGSGGGTTQPAVSAAPAMGPRADASTGVSGTGGIAGNNTGNIRDSEFAQSQPGYVGSGPNGFAQFDTLQNGLNAHGSLLASYGQRGFDTISKIVNRWAPAGDGNNNPAAYADFVSKQTGLDPNTPLDLSNVGTRNRIAFAMTRMEHGKSLPQGVQIASADNSFVPQAGAAASAPPTNALAYTSGGKPAQPSPTTISDQDYAGSQSGATAIDDATSVDPTTTAVVPGDARAGALQTHLLASPDGSPQRIAKLAKILSLQNLPEGQQKVATLFLQRELDNDKLPDAVKQFLFAKSPQGGGFQGGFADFQKKSQDRGDTIESATNMRAKLAPQYGLQPGTPEHRDFVLTGNLPNRGGSIEGQVTERTRLAPQLGLQQGTPAWQAYVANGKLPDQTPDATPEMRASEQKMFAGAQEKTRILQSQIGDLSRALQLNEQAYSGNYEPGAAQWAARNLPFGGMGMVDQKRVEATTEFNNLVGGATLSQGKELFGGRITNYDEKLLQDLKARPDMTPGERAVIIRNMIAHRQNVLAETNQDVADMRGGTRFQKGPNAAPGVQSGPGEPSSPMQSMPPQGIPPGGARQPQPGGLISRPLNGGTSPVIDPRSMPIPSSGANGGSMRPPVEQPVMPPSSNHPRGGVPAAPMAGGGVQEGMTATNPSTGERVVFRGGQWMRAQ